MGPEQPLPQPELTAGAAILLDVIEHCVNPGLALQHVSTVLNPNGRLILTRVAIEQLDSSACGMSYGLIARKVRLH